MTDPESDADKERRRLERRVMRLESTLEQLEQMRDTNARLLDRVVRELDAERTRSRELLLNVLPAAVVARLDAGESRIADSHSKVAVLMSDLVGFTEVAAGLSAVELVDQLNELFTHFDAACAERGVEKIKTIGDAYMAVAGLTDGGQSPARAAVELGLDMIDAVAKSSWPSQIRIGVHAGPAVAGVIGTHKFAYDVWGDTVNTASRLESTSLPGRIQVSGAVVDALGDDFTLEPRGEIELKGKGATATWLVLGRRSGPPL